MQDCPGRDHHLPLLWDLWQSFPLSLLQSKLAPWVGERNISKWERYIYIKHFNITVVLRTSFWNPKDLVFSQCMDLFISVFLGPHLLNGNNFSERWRTGQGNAYIAQHNGGPQWQLDKGKLFFLSLIMSSSFLWLGKIGICRTESYR